MTTDFSQIESSIVDVKKRDGRITIFNKEKITNAIYKALVANGNPDRKIAEELTSGVLSKLTSQGFSASHPPSVEDVQDMVESTLIEKGYGDIAKSYILYRHERRKVREDKMKVLNTKSLDPVSKTFDLNCLRVLASRYLLRNNKNEIIESPSQMFERVAILVGIGDILYDSEVFSKDGDIQQDVEEAKRYLTKLDDFEYKFKVGGFYLNKYHFRGLINHYIYLAKRGQMKKSFKEVLMLIAAKKFDNYADRIQEYYNLMTQQDFLPNSPTMMNAGARLGQLSACFVLGMPDDMGDIMKSTSDAALIFKSGGGVGINYSDLRHEGDIVASTSGVASGPVSFMNIINTVTEVVKQGGKRRGANMGILEVWHPDVERFITNKTQPGILENFNVSVGIWEDFWTALVESTDGKYTLRSPRDKTPVKEVNAHQLIDIIALSAWKSAEPGLIFFDNINKYNVFAKARGMPLRATNPCVTADTLVTTSEGPRTVRDLIDVPFKTHLNGRSWNTNGFFSTGVKKIYKLITKEGFELRLTEDHKVLTVKNMDRNSLESEWMQARDLKEDQKIVLDDCRYYEWDGKFGQEEGYLMGHMLGDGHIKKDGVVLSSWGESNGNASVRGLVLEYAQQMPHRVDFDGWMKVKGRDEYRLSLASINELAGSLCLRHEHKTITKEIEMASSAFYKGFLKGLFDADGTVLGSQQKGVSVRLSQSDIDILKAVQRMLLRLGIVSRIYANRRTEQEKMMPDGKGQQKLYHIKAQHELVVSGENLLRFYNVIGFADSEKMDHLSVLLGDYKRSLNKERFVATVVGLVEDGIEEVYDVQVPGVNAFDANGIVAHNCGEQSLYPYESCNLGSINLANLVKRKADGQYEFDWQRYEETIRKTTRFLDNVIDMNLYPVPEIDQASKESRRIGLGVMGVADLLYKLRIPYNSKEGYEFQSKLAEALTYYSMEESIALARSRGEFDLCARTEYPEGKIPVAGYYEKPKGSHYYDWDALIAKIQKHGIRNVLTTTVAPTGTLSMIADCSNGMEPTFALVFEKRVTVGRFFYTNKIFEQVLRENGLYSDEILAKIADNYGSVKGLKEIPEWIQNIFVTAMDIHWSDHLMAQAVWQDWIGNAIAKTINMPGDVSADDVKAAYLLAHELGLKGITVYRDGSRHTQVLHMTSENAEKTFDVKPSSYLREYITKNIKNSYIRTQVNNALELKIPDEPLRQKEVKEEISEDLLCPSCKNNLVFVEGCSICIECGFSGCTSG
jgi:ribonucleoside-diphosphate reductase alpha chain